MQKLLTTESIHHHFYFSDLLLFLYVITIRETGESIISEHGLWVLDFGMNMEKGCRIY